MKKFMRSLFLRLFARYRFGQLVSNICKRDAVINKVLDDLLFFETIFFTDKSAFHFDADTTYYQFWPRGVSVFKEKEYTAQIKEWQQTIAERIEFYYGVSIDYMDEPTLYEILYQIYERNVYLKTHPTALAVYQESFDMYNELRETHR